MNNRNVGIIATVATALLCGCPGLASLCAGVTTALASFVPGAEIDIFGSSDPESALYTGLGALCLGIILIAIPVVVGLLTLRRKPELESIPEEPIPPAI